MPLKCQIARVESHPVYEEQEEWDDENLHVSCRMFEMEKDNTIEEVNAFSHIVKWEKSNPK